jgi:hypothetical protein
MNTPTIRIASTPVTTTTNHDSPMMQTDPHQPKRIVSVKESSWPMLRNKKATNPSRAMGAA